MSQQFADITLADIIAVVPQLEERLDKVRRYVEVQYKESQGLTREECFARGLMYPEFSLDEAVMITFGMLQVSKEGIRVNPKWETIVKLAALMKTAPREKRREIKRKIDQIAKACPVELTGDK